MRASFRIALSISLATALGVTGCESTELPDSFYNRPTRAAQFEHGRPQAELKEKLLAAGVAFTESDDGMLVFENPNDERVSRALREIHDKYYAAPAALSTPDEIEELRQRFVDAGLTVRVITLSTDLSRIAWDPKDDQRAKQLIDVHNAEKRFSAVERLLREAQ